MTARDGLATPIQDAQQQLADALADSLVAHAQLLNEQGCPPVHLTAVLNLWAHVRRHQAPELDPVAARLVMRTLDLGWRPTTAATSGDEFGTPPMFDT